jgi:hypothetical protein
MGGMTIKYELKLQDGRVVEWSGASGEDAARRYVDHFRDAVVIAWREADRHGLHIGAPIRIIE